MNDNEDVELYCGKPNEPESQDGIVTSARFHSPHGIANMGSTLIVCDTGNKSIRLISNAGPLRKLSYTVVSPRSLQRGTKKTFDQALTVVEKLVEPVFHDVGRANWTKDWPCFYTRSRSNYY